jgi:hypothetical protein
VGDCGTVVIRHGDFLFRTEEQVHSFNFPFQLGTSGLDHPQSAQRFNIKLQHGDIVIMASDGVFDNLFDEEILSIVADCIIEPASTTNHAWKQSDMVVSPVPRFSGLFSKSALSPLTRSISKWYGNQESILPLRASSSLTPKVEEHLPLFPVQCDLEAIDALQLEWKAKAAKTNPRMLSQRIAQRAKEVAQDFRCSSPFQNRAIKEGLYYQGGKIDDISVVVGIVHDPSLRLRQSSA